MSIPTSKPPCSRHGFKKAFKKPPSQEPPSLHGSFLGLKLSKPSAFADSCFKKSFWLYASML